jgi:hypothetical protein
MRSEIAWVRENLKAQSTELGEETTERVWAPEAEIRRIQQMTNNANTSGRLESTQSSIGSLK